MATNDSPTRQLSTEAHPQPGDLLVAKDRPHRYVLSVVPREPQLWQATSECLLALARRFAERHQVDCWLADGTTYVRLGLHRRGHADPTRADTAAPARPAHRKRTSRTSRPVETLRATA